MGCPRSETEFLSQEGIVFMPANKLYTDIKFQEVMDICHFIQMLGTESILLYDSF